MAALCSWNLWGAAYYVLQGCGDDAFEYLRAWIVARGEASWRHAASDPEGWLVDLLDGAPDAAARVAALGLKDGEPILYAAGLAHQQLTGAWLPTRAGHPSEPAGEPWEEEDLPSRFSRLTAVLPDDWWEAEPAADDSDDGPLAGYTADRPPVLADAHEGVAAFSAGDHERAMALLLPLFDDPEAWDAVVEAGLAPDAEYVVGIQKLLQGDPDGAAEALTAALDPDAPRPDIRRALAVTLAFRRGDHGAARAAARELTGSIGRPTCDPSPADVPAGTTRPIGSGRPPSGVPVAGGEYARTCREYSRSLQPPQPSERSPTISSSSGP